MPLKTKCDAEVRLLLVSATTEHDRDMVRLLKGMSLIHADTFYEIYRNILEMDDNETSVRVARLLCQNFARQLAREKNPRNRHHQDSEEVNTQEEEETSEEEEEDDDEEEEEPLPLPFPRDEGILAGGKNRRPVYLKNEVGAYMQTAEQEYSIRLYPWIYMYVMLLCIFCMYAV